jgi:hypothetical protein
VKVRVGAAVALVAIASGETSLQAQQALAPASSLQDSASPFGPPPAAPADAVPVAMPELAFTPDGTEAADFDKYYAFHRDATDFDTAFADLAECDGYARGLQSGINYQQVPYPYAGTMAGAVGGALGSAMAMAIFGSAEKRRLRRVNMRTCMNYKGYDRFGLAKSVWDKFNFDEGLSSLGDEKRYRYLRQQAMVASAGKLQGKALGL